MPADRPGAGGSVLLLQRWRHDAEAWGALDVADQERAIGRTKIGSIELDPKPASAHAARTDQDEVGKIVRRNLAYGTVTRHGTMFVGLCRDREVLHEMLRRMAGIDGEPRDELTRYSRAETGAYYFLPSLTDLVGLGAGDSSCGGVRRRPVTCDQPFASGLSDHTPPADERPGRHVERVLLTGEALDEAVGVGAEVDVLVVGGAADPVRSDPVEVAAEVAAPLVHHVVDVVARGRLHPRFVRVVGKEPGELVSVFLEG